MAQALPPRPNVEWLRKTAKKKLGELRSREPGSKLADAQFALAREYGFSSWRSLKVHIDAVKGRQDAPLEDSVVGTFLRNVGNGDMAAARAALATAPRIVNAVGPHPFWGGRAQSLHVAIDTNRSDMFDLVLEHGADIDGDNREYDHWSPLMIAAAKQRIGMQRVLIERGARIGLFEALLLGDDSRVEKLLRPGVGALPRERRGDGSLLRFARTTYAIDRLLELGESRDSRDYWDETPVGSMSRLGAEGAPLVRHLQKRGFHVSAEDFAQLGDHEALMAMYAGDPAFIARDEVLMKAVESQNLELVSWLLERGANPNARTSFGSQAMALHGAAWNGNLALAKLLVAAGAEIHGRDVEHQNTPSGYARVARRITNNPDCDMVAEYLEAMEKGS